MRTLSVRKLAETITRLREEKNLTKEELGNLTGINRIMIGRIEREMMISLRQQVMLRRRFEDESINNA